MKLVKVRVEKNEKVYINFYLEVAEKTFIPIECKAFKQADGSFKSSKGNWVILNTLATEIKAEDLRKDK